MRFSRQPVPAAYGTWIVSLAICWAASLCIGETLPPAKLDSIQFNRDIRPILSARCYHCHGPDEHDREADLRLDVRSDDLADREIVVPGDPDASELVARILTDDPDAIMPPPAAKQELSATEIEMLIRWIAEGGAFDGHWAFTAPAKQLPPVTAPDAVIRNEIDSFVQQTLKSQGLQPSLEADRRTLIRRATFDLWGLPPTPDAIRDFVEDTAPNAYERLIDRLLDSPRYAERMTLAWMDAARYGDSSVFHADGPRDMWPWRDWVLNAYASNMPFDQFTVEQLAGDLLESPTTSQLVATGFNRNHGTSDEGGAIDEEYRVEYIVDRVKTTSMIWLGLTVECAQCHDHKYDPISQEDYYRFFAFFNQTPEKGMQTRNGNAEPKVMVPAPSEASQLAKLNASLKAAETKWENASPQQEEINAWVQSRLAGVAPLEFGDWYQVGPFANENVDKAFGKRFGPEREKTFNAAKKFGKLAWQHRPEWKDGTVHTFEYDGAGDATYLYREIVADEPSELDISLGSDDTISVWLNSKQLLKEKAARAAAADQNKIALPLNSGVNHLLIKVCNGSGQTGYYFKSGTSSLSEDLQAAVELAADERSAEQKAAIAKHFKQRVWPAGKVLKESVQTARNLRDEFEKTIPTVMVMREMKKPRMTYILNRGSYDAPDEERPVRPGPPRFLPTFAEGNLESRLGLAKWLTSPEHPLTARVTVNRYWMMLFGQGIVSTVADFGSQGAWPTNPALLDYLAKDFVDSGWDVKRMLRKMMTSHTYRQSSRVQESHRAIDPLNQYLARASRLRLSAEAIRDNALSVAGLLIEKVGGPGVKPYQPPGLWNEVSLEGNVRFTQDHGEKLYRRTMYTYWKRSSPQPAMMTFDVPTREKCVVQRQRTNTPLQALVTLNDTQFVEAARCFAQRVLQSDAPDDASRIDVAFEWATGRPADEKRQSVIRSLLDSETRRFAEYTKAAEELLAVGESARDTSLDTAQHAAWTVVTSVILNLDETLNKE